MSADINRADMTTVGLFDDIPDNWRDNPQAHAITCVIQNRPRALREMLASGLVELDKPGYIDLEGFPDRIPVSLVQAACIWKKAEPLEVLMEL